MIVHYLSICAVVLDEALYLEEWIEFHRLEGVDHFFIYDNGSTDKTHEILDFYEKKGIVTWEMLPEKPIQFMAYNKCLSDHGKESEWIAFLDIDEFLYGVKFRAFEVLQELLPHVGALAARWVLYGSSNKKDYGPDLITERFLRRCATPDKHFKSIVRPEATKCVGRNPHYFVLEKDFVAVDERGIHLPVEYGVTPDNRSIDRIRINHYHTKSFHEYLHRKTRPDPGSNYTRTSEEALISFRAHDCNEVFDASAAQHVNEITRTINEYHANNPHWR